MASVQERNGSYRVLFCHHGKLHAFTIGKVRKDEAENKARQVDYLLMRLKQKLIALPEGTDIVTFIAHDGNPPGAGPTLPNAPRQAVTLGHLKDRYLTIHANGTIEANSLDTCKLHLNHFVRVLGEGFPLGELSLAKMQEYVNHRAKAKISPVTIRKEIATFRAAWNWGEPMELTEGKFPNRGLRYPKADEKPPFMTMAEIERQLEVAAILTRSGRRSTCKPAKWPSYWPTSRTRQCTRTCRNLMTIPGIGAISSVAFTTAVDDPKRFTKSRSVGAYFGLTNRRSQSGEYDVSGRISKRGDTMVRGYLYEAAAVLLTRTKSWSALKSWGLRIAKRSCTRKAIVAVARKLAVIMHQMWLTGEAFRWSETEAVAA